jgi:type I restriction enzyme R subunit
MSAVHLEERFEDAIETWLIAHGGWSKGSKANYDMELALDSASLLDFLQDTQPVEWSRLVKKHGGQRSAEERFVQRVASEIDRRGTLDVLRNGMTDLGERFKLVYFKPASGLTPELVQRYQKNRLTVVRQLRYSAKTTDELDLAFFVNGIPTHDAELKNALTGQTVEHAKKQYRADRDPRERWFAKRSLVHFAVDTDEASLTTELEGADTAFIPFNVGHEGGQGNPPAASDDQYATSYLWERVWAAEAWLHLLRRFLHIDVTDIDGKVSRQVIFPRYHQWDAVQQLTGNAREKGPGQRYLVEHSAGSGNSNSIAWLAYSLMNLHDSSDQPVFDKVVVVSDRRNLDKQLRDTIRGFEHTAGIVEAAEHDSKELAAALDSAAARVIITTLWKFPVVVQRAQFFKERRYAVIIDEAHSSQTGEAAAQLKLVLGKGSAAEDEVLEQAAAAEEKAAAEDDPEEQIARMVEARGKQPNISFFAFTSTPKHRTLELFGTETDGHYEAFHRYTMRQAIEEGFILDVLANYTTYASYYKVGQKSAEEDPELPKREATAAIARWVSLHERQFAEKASVIAEHVQRHTAKKIGGKAKAMWVTRSRLHAVRSYHALRRYIEEKRYDIGVTVAFSGSIVDSGKEYTESGINGFSEGKLPEEFAKDNFQILVVAEKYQTGYDEPLLHTMFVDKKLENVKAVQTLSRLNRKHAGKEDTFVLDFVNEPALIQEAFKPYFEGAITEATDPNLLYNALDKVHSFGVIEEDDVEALIAILAKPIPAPSDHAKLLRLLDPAIERFKSLSEEDQLEFRDAARRFVRLYAFLGQILPYTDARAEKLYAYIRTLLRRLPQQKEGRLDLGDRLLLTHLRIEKTGDHDLSLDHGQGELPGFGGDGRGPQVDDERDHLSELIRVINDRFGANLGKADQLVVEALTEHMSGDSELRAAAHANTEENFRFGFDKKFESMVLDRYEANEALFGKVLGDPEWGDLFRQFLARAVYEQIRSQPKP